MTPETESSSYASSETDNLSSSPRLPRQSRREHNNNKLSCAECRRRKLKCDRKVPCSACTRRGCSELCPNGVMEAKYTSALPENQPAFIAMRERVATLENTLKQYGLPVPSTSPGSSATTSYTSASYSSFTSKRKMPGSVETTPRPFTEIEARTQAWSPLSEPMLWRGQVPPIDPQHRGENDDDWVPSFGSLVIGHGGRSRYVGSTGASEWLNETMASGGLQPQMMNTASMPSLIRGLGPAAFLSHDGTLPNIMGGFGTSRQEAKIPEPTFFFPFPSASSKSYGWLRAQLPSRDEASALVGYYFRHYSWNYNIISKAQFATLFASFYDTGPTPPSNEQWTYDTHPHKLALLFMVLAMGSLFNLEVETDQEPGRRFYVHCSECLALGDLLRHNTMASLQTMHIMINYVLYVDRIKGGDTAWLLWGIAWRLILAMGMHRDGERWKLSGPILDERRRVFWECFSEEAFQSNCFGRPGGIPIGVHDVELPEELETRNTGEGYSTLKFRLSVLATEVSQQVMAVEPPPYEKLMQLYHRIVALEKTVPYNLRCQPACLALLSVFPTQAEALAASPPVNVSELRLTFQQHGLAINFSETIMFLLRPYFARALHDDPSDPSRGKFGEAFLAVVERSRIIIAVVSSIHQAFPRLAYRHWFFAYHASTAAVCMASLVLTAPRSPLALLGWSHLQTVCNLFTSIAPKSKSTTNSLNLLLHLRQAAYTKLRGRWQYTDDGVRLVVDDSSSTEDEVSSHDTSDAEEQSSILIGLHSRLVNRMNRDMALSHVIRAERKSDIVERKSSGKWPLQKTSPSRHASLGDLTGDSAMPPVLSPLAQSTTGGVNWYSQLPQATTHDPAALATPHPLSGLNAMGMDLDNISPESLSVFVSSMIIGYAMTLMCFVRKNQMWPRGDDEQMLDWTNRGGNLSWDSFASAIGMDMGSDPGG